jgi:hypothetical protein
VRCGAFAIAALLLVVGAARSGVSGEAAGQAVAGPRTAQLSQSGSVRRGSSCAITTRERVVAIGDVHGAYGPFVDILRAAGLIDGRDRWSGGRALLVQTGDVLDRGADSRRVLDLLQRLESEAASAGGAVHALLGNHEAMRIMRDLRYVSREEYAAFRSPDSETLRQRYYDVLLEGQSARAREADRDFDEPAFRREFLAAIPPGFVEMQIAFEATGAYGRWLRERDTMIRVNDVVFVHGGLTRDVAALGCEAVNATVRSELSAMLPLDDPRLTKTLSVGADGPLWHRGLVAEGSTMTSEEVDDILGRLDARTIVVGHTVAEGLRIRQRHEDRVVQIDTGMLGGTFYPGGLASALEIHNGIFTAIYEDRRQVLFERRAGS